MKYELWFSEKNRYLDKAIVHFDGGCTKELKVSVHRGTIQDSCLIDYDNGYPLRWFPMGNYYEFYRRKGNPEVLIHNETNHMIKIRMPYIYYDLKKVTQINVEIEPGESYLFDSLPPKGSI